MVRYGHHVKLVGTVLKGVLYVMICGLIGYGISGSKNCVSYYHYVNELFVTISIAKGVPNDSIKVFFRSVKVFVLASLSLFRYKEVGYQRVFSLYVVMGKVRGQERYVYYRCVCHTIVVVLKGMVLVHEHVLVSSIRLHYPVDNVGNCYIE